MDEILKLVQLNFLYLVGTAALLLVLGIILFINKKVSDTLTKWWRSLLESIKGGHKINHITQEIISNINMDLSALRGKLDADRSYIVEFHNGSVFASRMPQWRISKTYERVKAGKSYESYRLQSVSVSLLWDYLVFLFNETVDKFPPGMQPVTSRNREMSCQASCSNLRRVYYLDVNNMDMDLGPTRAILEQQGVTQSFITPIIDSSKTVIGYVGVEYDRDEDVFNDTSIDVCELCKFASQVALVWEMNKNLKDKMIAHQKKLWNKNEAP